ncbi:MAG: cytidylate kinase-like family protein [Clostridia bacterium]|nr:cytidylate kinase-like family protein [Clostridia bacterium]
MANNIIAIGRQYGSGGREIGEALAKKLGVKCYDKELITISAQKSGMCKELFEDMDEKPIKAMYYMEVAPFAQAQYPINHQLFLAQMNVIREIAQRESCVFIGRCADYVLAEHENCHSVFVHAPFADRVKRAMERTGLEERKAEKLVRKIDREREAYYDFYTSKLWGAADTYDLSLNSSAFGTQKCVDIIAGIL